MRNKLLVICGSILVAFSSQAQTCQDAGIGTNTPMSKLEIRGCTNLSNASALNVTDSNAASIFYIRNDHRIGINTTSPASTFSIGSSNQFQVNSTGNLIFINNVSYSWPGSQGAANTELTNDGSGNLTWSTGSSSAWLLVGNSGTTPGTNFIGTTDAKDFIFKTNNSERMRITSGGNVGIGSTSPVCALDVGGYLHISGATTPTVTAQGGYLSWNGLTAGTGETDFINNQGGGSGGFAFFNTASNWASRTTSMVITGGGNVGVGNINSPANLFQVNQTSNITPATSGTYGIALYNQTLVNATIGSDASYVYMQSWQSKPLQINNQGNNTIINVSSGDVGIGVSSPGEKLDVSGADANGAISIFRNVNYWMQLAENMGSGAYSSLTQTNDNGIFWTDGLGTSGKNSASGFVIAPWQGSSNGIRINGSNGNVGIGTGTPAAPLDVNGSVRGAYNTAVTSYFGESAVGFVSGQNGASFAFIANNTSTGYALLQYTTNTYLNALSGYGIVFRNNNSNIGEWTSTGLGVGTTSPLATLDISGGHIRSEGTTPTIAVTTQNGITAAALSSNSDTKGAITTTGTNNGTNTVLTITFNIAYNSAPIVVMTSANANAQACTYYVTSTTTTFVFTFKGGGATPSFNYYVIE